MFNKFRSIRPRASHVVAAVAICAAMGGTAYADNEWGSANIIDNSLTTSDVMDGSLTGNDIKNGSIASQDIATLGMDLTTASVNATLANGQTATVKAVCPTTKRALGGGFDAGNAVVQASYPDTNSTGWVVRFKAPTGTLFGTPVIVYAQCAKIS